MIPNSPETQAEQMCLSLGVKACRVELENEKG